MTEFIQRMCPIGLDEHPTICSAGYCDVCIGNRLKGLSEELTAATSEVERLKAELDLAFLYASYCKGCAMTEDINPDDYETWLNGQ